MAPKNTGGLAHLKEVRRVLAEGGIVRFHWSTCSPILIHPNGESFTPIDGRSYHAFQETADQKYTRTETGSTETKDLVIEWKRK